MHHVDVHVSDAVASRRFFDAIMPLVGYEPRVDSSSEFAYWCAERRPAIAFTLDADRSGSGSMRIAFAVPTSADVDRAAAAAAHHGARNIEGPGIHPEYGDEYYAVFFEDLDGNKFEVCLADT